MKIKNVIKIVLGLPLVINLWAEDIVVQLDMPQEVAKQEEKPIQPSVSNGSSKKESDVLVVSQRNKKDERRLNRIAKRRSAAPREQKMASNKRLKSEPIDYRTLVDPEDEEVSTMLPFGHEYYHTLLDKASYRRWALITSVHWSVAHKGYDDDHCLVPLSKSVFSKDVSIGDIFLLGRLMRDKLVSNLQRFDAPYTSRPFERPQTSMRQFGFYPSDQYPALLAETLLGLAAEQRSLCFNIAATYRFNLNCSGSIQGMVGMNLPIEEQLHILDTSLRGGSLYRPIFTSNNTIRDNPLFAFFQQFSGLEDYINTILGDKDLALLSRQRRTGVGDISLFGLVDFAGLLPHVDGLQVGLNVTVPSGREDDARTIWQPVLGNGGGTDFDIFFQALFNSPSPVFNPTLRLVGGFSKSFTSVQRVGRQVVNNNPVAKFGRSALSDVPNLQNPLLDFQDGYFVDSFSLFDVNVPFFADSAVPVELKHGNRFLVSVGNYMYNFLNLGFRFGVFYDYSYKRSDRFCLDATSACPAIADGTFDFCLLERLSRCNFHRFSWNLTYKFRNLIELNVGSSHIVTGRNTPRTHEVYCGFVAVF